MFNKKLWYCVVGSLKKKIKTSQSNYIPSGENEWVGGGNHTDVNPDLAISGTLVSKVFHQLCLWDSQLNPCKKLLNVNTIFYGTQYQFSKTVKSLQLKNSVGSQTTKNIMSRKFFNYTQGTKQIRWV